MNWNRTIGLTREEGTIPEKQLIEYINLKLAFLGCPTVPLDERKDFYEMASSFLSHHRETDRLLADYLCPADQRIQDFLNRSLEHAGPVPKLPSKTFVLDQHGLARTLSLPPAADEFVSDIVRSYRVQQGVLHNPKSDRRTTKGVFHVAEGGLPVPDDKKLVPQSVFARLLEHAMNPPQDLMRLPFTSAQKNQASCFVSLLLRPVVCPEVPGYIEEKSLETRFFTPGNLVSNLDFVESIFGNAGDPFLPENDAALDVFHWTGHTGCVILAPHLTQLRKMDLGLPLWENASERERRDGMCWREESELYNDGTAFKLTMRDESGVMVTLIADNYFGYCKKEVKTQISYSANLYGLCEEEHAGGALVYPAYDLGEEFSGHLHVKRMDHSFDEVTSKYSHLMDLKPEGYAVDKTFPSIIYVSEDVHFDLHKQTVSWPTSNGNGNGRNSIKLLPGHTYVRPSGYKVHMEKPPGNRAWRLIGTVAEATLCHKPCTVSGGGKSEISKPISDAIIQGPVFVADFKKDFDQVSQLIQNDYSNRFKDPAKIDKRPVLSKERSLGSVIKLLTPASREYTPVYNDWLASIPQYIKELVFVVKRFYRPEWGDKWRDHFSVDIINGTPGNELKCDNRKLVSNYLRVGFDPDGSWRTFGLRKDFHPAFKLSVEDDITASVVVPADTLSHLNNPEQRPSVKLVHNCEYRLFQRPDDAIHRGYDRLTESDFAKEGNFFSNYEPLRGTQAGELIEDAIGFDKFTEPMKQVIRQAAQGDPDAFFVSSAHPRVIDGKPSKNPRYLQTRLDLVNPRDRYLSEIATRLHRRIPPTDPVLNPVTAVVPGRRNNPPDPVARIRSLAVYNPIHYMDLPELFIEFICSMTGKSPSTTGAGSEGAMTKGPFNALLPILDLNNALVSYLLTGYEGFVTSAGSIGPHCRVDHDVSMLIPEIWCRMTPQERDARFLIRNGYLERCEDFDHKGRTILSSRLGYRITRRFVRTYFGRVFNHPHVVFTDEMLQPERQDLELFVDGMDNVIGTQRRVAESYFKDGSVEQASPPLKALLHIMKEDRFEGKDLNHPDIRALFTRESMVKSDWYRARLTAKQRQDIQLWEQHVDSLGRFLNKASYADEARRLGMQEVLEKARNRLAAVQSPHYLEELKGTIGLQTNRS